LRALSASLRVPRFDAADGSRPWGTFTVLARGPGFLVKRLAVAPGGALSLQRHRHRTERWLIVAGRARVTVHARVREVGPWGLATVPRGAIHRLENAGFLPLIVLELQTGGPLDERDIERFEDRYGRVPGDRAGERGR
jgi:mannose-1-phosphate guanylyltransferase / mannose-6-phosphate isomerase